jgi:acetyl esterase
MNTTLPRVDAEVQAILDQIAVLAAQSPPLPQIPIEVQRRSDQGFARLCRGDRTIEAVSHTQDHSASGRGGTIPLRLYFPADGPAVGTLMFFHGGGFLRGDLDSHDDLCRALCNAARAVVVGVHYRRAPEHRFPAAFEDACDATAWIAGHAQALGLPAGRLAVSGDSAGGNLAASVAQWALDQGRPALCFQLLIYPETSASMEWPSVKEFWEPGRMAAGKGMGWFRSQYFAEPAAMQQPYAYPDNRADLRGLPPALVITAEIDPMRDMGEAYAQRLQDVGVPTTLLRYAGVTHVFMSMLGRVAAARRALAEAGAAVHAALRA